MRSYPIWVESHFPGYKDPHKNFGTKGNPDINVFVGKGPGTSELLCEITIMEWSTYPRRFSLIVDGKVLKTLQYNEDYSAFETWYDSGSASNE